MSNRPVATKKIRVIAEVEANDDFSLCTVRIGSDVQPLPYEAVLVATEHLMTMVASDSKLGFDQAIDVLAERAKANKCQAHRPVNVAHGRRKL